MTDPSPSFHGLRVAAFESRRADEIARLIERFAGTARVTPSLREVPITETSATAEFAQRVLVGEIGVAVFLTGVGFQHLLGTVERQVNRERYLHALADIVTIARGPKVAHAMREVGLAPTHVVDEPHTWRELLTTVDQHVAVDNQVVKGIEHEQAYVAHLKSQELNVCELEGHSFDETKAAILKGYDIITQARFEKEGWVGIADILRKVSGNSQLGNYYYEVEDTKLARETKAGTVLQLCMYTEFLGEIQGRIPEYMYVIKPGIDFPKDMFRYPEFEAYYRFVKNRFHQVIMAEPVAIYPLPVAKCDTCRWWKECNAKWHNDDHLCLIAGVRSHQMKELEHQGIFTLETYAQEPEPYRKVPEQGNEETYKKIHQQAKIQLKGRNEKKMLYQLLPVEPLRGLNRLPELSKGDLYFDIEGDHFYEEGGIEYLFGIAFLNEKNDVEYKGYWAKTGWKKRICSQNLCHSF